MVVRGFKYALAVDVAYHDTGGRAWGDAVYVDERKRISGERGNGLKVDK